MLPESPAGRERRTERGAGRLVRAGGDDGALIVTRFGSPSRPNGRESSGSVGSLMSKTLRPSNPAPINWPSHVEVAAAGEFQERTRMSSQTTTSP